nr:altered inheritance of mitochondria protein 32-like [Tanacetum cinerariifolium]
MPKTKDFSCALHTFDIGQNDLTVRLFQILNVSEVKANVPDIVGQFKDVIKVDHRPGAGWASIRRVGLAGEFDELISEKGLKESDIKSFVEEVIVNRKLWSTGVQETMTGSHLFVCSHSSRDKRCGYCGQILIKKFKAEAGLRGLKNVSVTAFSHVGGHKYARNLIIYSVRDAKVSGHWYGYVTPSDVPELLDNHIGNGEIIDRLGGTILHLLCSGPNGRSSCQESSEGQDELCLHLLLLEIKQAVNPHTYEDPKIESVGDKENGKSSTGLNDEMCTFCEMAVVWMRNQIKRNETEDNIINYVNESNGRICC